METNFIQILTSKDDKSTCAFAKTIVEESETSNRWYKHFDDFATLLDYPKSLARNKAIWILASLAKWDTENKFDSVIKKFLEHVEDEKTITTRQCVQALSLIGKAKKQYIPMILKKLECADLSKYKDSMSPLIKKDIAQTKNELLGLAIKN